MRYPPGHKQRTHQRILDTAARLFRKHGYAATGVDAVMTSAGLTAGGFYAHFRSKQVLLAEALELAFQLSRDHWRSRLQDREGPAWVRAHIMSYLSQDHRDAAEHGCPMPALGAEIARLSPMRSEEHTSELQSPCNLVCRLLLEKKKKKAIAASTSNGIITRLHVSHAAAPIHT